MKNLIILSLALVFVLTTAGLSTTAAQAIPASTNPGTGTMPLSEAEIGLMRRDLRSEKKKIIALNVQMTEDEATRFWPVYDKYVAEMTRLHDGFYAVIKDYSENSKTWSEAQATTMLDKWVKFQLEEAKTRQKFIPLFEKAVTPKKTALFLQIDRRLYALLDLQVTTFLPLVTQQ